MGLEKGETAPFAGMLLTNKMATYLGQKADSFDKRLEIEVEYKTSRLQLDLDLERKLRQIDTEAKQAQINLLTEQLDQTMDRPWYEHPAFVAVATATGVILVVIGTGYALKNI